MQHAKSLSVRLVQKEDKRDWLHWVTAHQKNKLIPAELNQLYSVSMKANQLDQPFYTLLRF